MLTKDDKKWVKDAIHEEMADLLVNHIQPTLATKNDLKNFATKDDLKEFVTKKDLREELKNLATKDDLKNFATKDDINGIKNTLDHFFAELKDMKQEQVVLSHKTYLDLSPKLDDHETRLIHLEKAI